MHFTPHLHKSSWKLGIFKFDQCVSLKDENEEAMMSSASNQNSFNMAHGVVSLNVISCVGLPCSESVNQI